MPEQLWEQKWIRYARNIDRERSSTGELLCLREKRHEQKNGDTWMRCARVDSCYVCRYYGGSIESSINKFGT